MSDELTPRPLAPYCSWRPIVDRPKFAWPGGMPLTAAVLVRLEHLEPNDIRQYGDFSLREYGNRIGIFRLMDAMDRVGMKGTAAIDAYTAARKPALVEACLKRGWEIIGHGLVGNQPLTSQLTASEEREQIARTLDLMERYTGQRPIGWLGPEYGESTRTPQLLAELGVRYVCDWPNDEQPYEMVVAKGSLVSLPIILDFDDAFSIVQRQLSTWRWADAVIEAAGVLAKDGTESARLLLLSIRPWIMGQPHRIRIFERVLQTLAAGRAWLATGREITDHYLAALSGTS